MLRVYCIYIAKSVTLLVDECGGVFSLSPSGPLCAARCSLCYPLALSVQHCVFSVALWPSLCSGCVLSAALWPSAVLKCQVSNTRITISEVK